MPIENLIYYILSNEYLLEYFLPLWLTPEYSLVYAGDNTSDGVKEYYKQILDALFSLFVDAKIHGKNTTATINPKLAGTEKLIHNIQFITNSVLAKQREAIFRYKTYRDFYQDYKNIVGEHKNANLNYINLTRAYLET